MSENHRLAIRRSLDRRHDRDSDELIRPLGCNPGRIPEFSKHNLWEQWNDDAHKVRCRRRSECLGYANARGWKQMTCEHCEVDDEYEDGSEEARRDYVPIAMLVARVKQIRIFEA